MVPIYTRIHWFLYPPGPYIYRIHCPYIIWSLYIPVSIGSYILQVPIYTVSLVLISYGPYIYPYPLVPISSRSLYIPVSLVPIYTSVPLYHVSMVLISYGPYIYPYPLVPIYTSVPLYHVAVISTTFYA